MPKTVAVEAPEVGKRKTYTNWSVFEKAKITPTTITCDVIRFHPADEACKTRLGLSAQSMVDHINAQHGGGFAMKFKQTDGKAWPGWAELAQAGAEVHQFKCEVCDNPVQLSVRDINNHLRPHKGKFRGAYQNFKDTFFLVVQFQPPTSGDEDDEFDYNSVE